MSIKAESGAEFLLESAKTSGVACSTVKDGHVLIFTEERLKLLLEACQKSGTGLVTIFVKRPDFTQGGN